MKAVGLITEYNPFHNGHKYHIEEAKRAAGADYAVAVMSGDFVQRGAPALIDKYSRAEMALLNGADLVLELPVCYAAGSAEFFAQGAVSVLDQLGIIDALCFGSECGDIGLLREAALFLAEAPEGFDERLQAFLKDGLTYPAARLRALQHTLKSNRVTNEEALSKILTEPNNILGIEYIKALHLMNSPIAPITIQRIAAHYHAADLTSPRNPADTMFSAGSSAANTAPDPAVNSRPGNPVISSATAIRKAIGSIGLPENYFEEIRHSVPEEVFRILTGQYLKTYPVTEEDFSSVIRYKLLSEDKQSLSSYMDISRELADRIKNFTNYHSSISALTQALKTRNLTLTRINRALIHLLLNIKASDVAEYNRNGYARYARVLGIKKESSRLLRKIEECGRIPVITRVSKAEEQLDSLGMRMLSGDIFAAHLYNQAVYEKYGTSLPNEYQHGICIV